MVSLFSQVWVFNSVGCEKICQLAMGFRAACTHSGSRVLLHAIADEKLSVLRPSIAALRQPDLIVAERLSMGFRGVLLMWRTVADVAVQDEEGGAALRLAKHLQGVFDAINIVSVADPQNAPTVTQESGRDVLREGDSRIPFNGDVVCRRPSRDSLSQGGPPVMPLPKQHPPSCNHPRGRDHWRARTDRGWAKSDPPGQTAGRGFQIVYTSGAGRSHPNSMPVQGGGLNLFWTGMSGHESGAGGRVCLVIPTRVRMRHSMSSPEDWRSSSENGSLLLGKAIL
jgi:hypothetical protein